MPSDELFKLAKTTNLQDPTLLNQVLDLILTNTKTKTSILDFYMKWLRTNNIPNFNPSSTAFVNLAAQGNPVDLNYNYSNDMKQELIQMLDYFTFKTQSQFSDLLTTDISFTSSPQLAQLYGVTPRANTNDLSVKFNKTERSGLLTRAGMLVTGTTTSNPIMKAVFLRQDFLCNPAPRPSIANFAVDFRSVSEFDPTWSTRQKYEAKTTAPACAGCHASINPYGFPFESYDPFGRHRLNELVFGTTGDVISQPSIDARSSLSLGGKTFSINGPVDLSKAIASNGQAPMCFVKNYFRHTMGKTEHLSNSNYDDGCILGTMDNALRGNKGSIYNMLSSFTKHRSFFLNQLESTP